MFKIDSLRFHENKKANKYNYDNLDIENIKLQITKEVVRNGGKVIIRDEEHDDKIRKLIKEFIKINDIGDIVLTYMQNIIEIQIFDNNLVHDELGHITYSIDSYEFFFAIDFKKILLLKQGKNILIYEISNKKIPKKLEHNCNIKIINYFLQINSKKSLSYHKKPKNLSILNSKNISTYILFKYHSIFINNFCILEKTHERKLIYIFNNAKNCLNSIKILKLLHKCGLPIKSFLDTR
jgi:hypothetical protein